MVEVQELRMLLAVDAGDALDQRLQSCPEGLIVIYPLLRIGPGHIEGGKVVAADELATIVACCLLVGSAIRRRCSRCFRCGDNFRGAGRSPIPQEHQLLGQAARCIGHGSRDAASPADELGAGSRPRRAELVPGASGATKGASELGQGGAPGALASEAPVGQQGRASRCAEVAVRKQEVVDRESLPLFDLPQGAILTGVIRVATAHRRADEAVRTTRVLEHASRIHEVQLRMLGAEAIGAHDPEDVMYLIL
mmetsp:Transcript_65755/g.140673  ORF Transcript_65755/g.140673 Transcript_65755/m.140673 type:complete len:251 (+) Transcript_65755:235-987(+)